MPKVYVSVQLKNEILDPQGKAILSALKRLGLENLTDLKQGKFFVLDFLDNLDSQTVQEVYSLAESFLSNPVIEDYSIEVKNET